MSDETKPELTDNQKIGLLADKVIWSINYLKCPGSGFMAKRREDGSMQMIYWINDFCDVLDQIGVHVDREALEELRNPKKRKSK